MENDPNDNFADSEWAQIGAFTVSLLVLSTMVVVLYLAFVCVDNRSTRIGLVAANAILLISAVLMVMGGDMVMIIDICLSIYWGYETYQYFKSCEM